MNARPSTEVLFAAQEDAAAFYRRQLVTPTTTGPRRVPRLAGLWGAAPT